MQATASSAPNHAGCAMANAVRIAAAAPARTTLMAGASPAGAWPGSVAMSAGPADGVAPMPSAGSAASFVGVWPDWAAMNAGLTFETPPVTAAGDFVGGLLDFATGGSAAAASVEAVSAAAAGTAGPSVEAWSEHMSATASFAVEPLPFAAAPTYFAPMHGTPIGDACGARIVARLNGLFASSGGMERVGIVVESTRPYICS